jgi:hypothetical protein
MCSRATPPAYAWAAARSARGRVRRSTRRGGRGHEDGAADHSAPRPQDRSGGRTCQYLRVNGLRTVRRCPVLESRPRGIRALFLRSLLAPAALAAVPGSISRQGRSRPDNRAAPAMPSR